MSVPFGARRTRRAPRFLSCAAAALALVAGRGSLAQAAPSDESAPAADSVRPAEATPRTRELMGFTASAAVGPGMFFGNSGLSPDIRRFRGGTVSFAASMGFHLSPEVSLAATYLRDQVFALSARDTVVDGDEPNLDNISFFLSSAGVLLDFEVLKRPEIHMAVAACRGQLFVDGRGSSSVDNPAGWVFALTSSVEFRIHQLFTVGGAFRFTYAPLSVSEVAPDRSVNVFIPALLLTARYK
jgi:hypothetical protein